MTTATAPSLRNAHGSHRLPWGLPWGLPWVTLALTGGLAALFGFGVPAFDALAYDRAAIAGGEVWRLVTGHWVHADSGHALWNLGALLLLGALGEGGALGRRGVAAALGLGILAVSVVLWVGLPGLPLYCGLSGALNTLFVALLLAEARTTGSRLPLALVAADGLKITVEAALGGSLFTEVSLPPVWQAHAAGFVAGMLWALAPRWSSGCARVTTYHPRDSAITGLVLDGAVRQQRSWVHEACDRSRCVEGPAPHAEGRCRRPAIEAESVCRLSLRPSSLGKGVRRRERAHPPR